MIVRIGPLYTFLDGLPPPRGVRITRWGEFAFFFVNGFIDIDLE